MPISAYIAFADDDADDREMLADRFLKLHPDIPIAFFNEGQEIIRYLENCPTADLPAVLLLDYKMPMKTGADVLRTLQPDSRYDKVRKIVWSTSGNKQYATECLKYGAGKYFTKPDDIQQLDVIVTHLADIFHSTRTGGQNTGG